MSSIRIIFKSVNRTKVKIFLFFLCCSFLSWAVSTLSEVYESHTDFHVIYKNTPDSLLLGKKSHHRIAAKIKANGFQFLGYAIAPKRIVLDLKDVQERDGLFYLTSNIVKSQLENQLPNSISLVDSEALRHHVDLYAMAIKKLPVIPQLSLRLAQNHILKGELKVEPDTIQIKGSRKQIEQITHVYTTKAELNNITNSFSKKLGLQVLDSMNQIVINTREVIVSGTVVHFSEKQFDVALKPINIPNGYRIRMFPDHVQLICKAGINTLRNLSDSDFEVFVDYDAVVNDNYLFVELAQKPDDVFSMRFSPNHIEFVLERQ